MVTLNNYLYSGNTVLKILHSYHDDLLKDAKLSGSPVDLAHCQLLKEQTGMLEHNDFLTSQSQRIKEFYKYMANKYPWLAFTFKGRIKSLIRAEEKFNGYIIEYIYNYYMEHGEYPSEELLSSQLFNLRDLIAYRIVIQMPECHIGKDEDIYEAERAVLYEIANALPAFLEERDFELRESGFNANGTSDLLSPEAKPYFRDYVETPTLYGYQSLHLTCLDKQAGSYIEVQLRTKDMDDYAEIGPANHFGYEKRQEAERTHREQIPVGQCLAFDEAYEREILLQNLDLSKLRVNMFAAVNNSLINDGCGLYRGRLILPFEHLSRFQNDIID